MTVITASRFWIWCHKLGTPISGQLCLFFAAPLKLHQVGWGESGHSQIQASLKGCYWSGDERCFVSFKLDGWHSCHRVQSLSHQTGVMPLSWSESPSIGWLAMYVSVTWQWILSSHSTIQAWWSDDEMIVFLERCPLSPQRMAGALTDWLTVGFLVTSLSKALLPWLLSLDGRPDLEKALPLWNFFHLQMMEAVFIETFKAASFFFSGP